MPVPHFNIKITQRSKGNSAVAGAAYQAGEKLFSEYDQKTKNYTCKKEVVYVPCHFSGAEHRQDRAGTGNQCVSGGQHCPEAQLRTVSAGFSAGAGAYVLTAAGRLPDRNSAGTDHQQHGNFCAVYYAGAVRQR